MSTMVYSRLTRSSCTPLNQSPCTLNTQIAASTRMTRPAAEADDGRHRDHRAGSLGAVSVSDIHCASRGRPPWQRLAAIMATADRLTKRSYSSSRHSANSVRWFRSCSSPRHLWPLPLRRLDRVLHGGVGSGYRLQCVTILDGPTKCNWPEGGGVVTSATCGMNSRAILRDSQEIWRCRNVSVACGIF